MDKRVILAVAGAGKTYHICHSLDPNKRNLILAFTHENIHNIRNELFSAYGHIPKLTTISTFDSFVYHNFVLPYEPTIGAHFGRSEFKSRGICTVEPPAQTIKEGKRISPNKNYKKQSVLEHYITQKEQYYCANLSELVLQVPKKNLLNRAINRLNFFWDRVLVDEFQYFRGHNHELIMLMSRYINEIVLVGDYYQHSVSGTNNSGKPFDKNDYKGFVEYLQNHGFMVDQKSLNQSRRCSKDVCDFVRKKLGIDITSCGINKGRIVWADDFAEEILNDQEILKLLYKEASKYSFRSMNWSYSKGDTVGKACVVLTRKFEKIAEDTFSPKGIGLSTLNRLYVAMTRSSGDLYLIKYSTFKKVESQYLQESLS